MSRQGSIAALLLGAGVGSASAQLGFVNVSVGPGSAAMSTDNMPLVTVEVCDTPLRCVSVGRVLLDTGSTGLRVHAGALGGIDPFPMHVADKGVLAECSPYRGGHLWGGVRMAWIGIGGVRTRAPVPIQVLADPDLPPPPPGCAIGAQPVTPQEPGLGMIGVLGIGPQRQDCGPTCIGASDGGYYACDADGDCRPATAALSTQVANPVAAMPAPYNDGSVLVMSAVPSPTGSPWVGGKFALGLRPETLFMLQAGNMIHPLDAAGETRARIASAGPDLRVRFASGSSALELPPESVPGILQCPAPFLGLFCPQFPESLDVRFGDLQAGGWDRVTVANAIALLTTEGNAALPGLARFADAPGRATFGMPFYFGRGVATGLEGTSQEAPNGFVQF